MPEEIIGIESLEKIVDAAAEGINVGHKMATGGGIFAAFNLTDEIAALGTIPKGSVIAQLKDLSKEERAKLHLRFKGKLVLSDKELESRIEDGDDCLEEVVSLGYEQYDLIVRGKDLFNKVLGLFKPKQ